MADSSGSNRSQQARIGQSLCLAALLLSATAVQAGALQVAVVDQAGKPVEDAVVTATALAPPTDRTAGPTEGIVDQIDKTFVPYVTAVHVGTQVRFPNSDNIRHHVYSFSPTKRFELPLYAGTHAAPVLFDKPGIVVMGCNIHDWMVGYVYVSDTPYFAKTTADGTAQLRDLPPGQYTLHVWHPEMDGPEQATGRTVRLDEQGLVTASWTIARLDVFRPRRAPVSRNAGY